MITYQTKIFNVIEPIRNILDWGKVEDINFYKFSKV